MKSVGNEEGRGKRSLLGLSLEALFSGGRHFPSPLLCSQGTFPDKHTDLFSTGNRRDQMGTRLLKNTGNPSIMGKDQSDRYKL